MKRSVFFISDGTGITAETLGHSLLAQFESISFDETDAPGGAVTVTFSGGAALRLEVECLDAQMRDMGERWQARAAPAHAIDDTITG